MGKDSQGKKARDSAPFVEIHESELSPPRFMYARVERGIRKRVRTDGAGGTTYEVEIFVDGNVVRRTFTSIPDARGWRDRRMGPRR